MCASSVVLSMLSGWGSAVTVRHGIRLWNRCLVKEVMVSRR